MQKEIPVALSYHADRDEKSKIPLYLANVVCNNCGVKGSHAFQVGKRIDEHACGICLCENALINLN